MTSHSEVLTQPCQSADAAKVLVQSRDYVRMKLGWDFLADYAPLFATAEYQGIRLAIAEALAAGDVDRTKEACRAWCKVVIRWTRRHAAGGTTRGSCVAPGQVSTTGEMER
jgi:hypothetical protein